MKKFWHGPCQTDKVITAVGRRAEHHRICLQRFKRGGKSFGRQRRAIAPNDDGRRRTFAEAVGECAGHALAEVAFALRAAKPAVAEPMLHRVRVVTGKTDFQFHVLRLTQSVGGSKRAKNEPAMQRGCAFRSERGDEASFHLSGDGKASEQNQSASLVGHGSIVAASPLPGEPAVHQVLHERRQAGAVVKVAGLADGFGLGRIRMDRSAEPRATGLAVGVRSSRYRLGASPTTELTPGNEMATVTVYKRARTRWRRWLWREASLKPCWGKPAVRNFRGGGGNEVQGLMTFCHAARKGGNIGSHWPKHVRASALLDEHERARILRSHHRESRGPLCSTPA